MDTCTIWKKSIKAWGTRCTVFKFVYSLRGMLCILTVFRICKILFKLCQVEIGGGCSINKEYHGNSSW